MCHRKPASKTNVDPEKCCPGIFDCAVLAEMKIKISRPASAPPAKRGNGAGRPQGGGAAPTPARAVPAAAPAKAESAAPAVAAVGDAEPDGSLNRAAAVDGGTDSFDTLDAYQYGEDGEEILWNNG